MLSERYTSLVALLVLLCGCASQYTPQGSQVEGTITPHFKAPEQLVLADSLELKRWVGHPKQPQYPSEMQERGVEAKTIAAFVVDTAGVIELATVSFLGQPEHLFIVEICRALGETRYYPVERAGGKRRALMLASFMFGIEGGTLIGAAPPDVQAARRAIEQEGLLASVVELEHKPHCR